MPPFSRRTALALIALAPLAEDTAASADQWVEVADDAGAPIPNLRIPVELDPFALPGLLWFGDSSPDVHLFEFTDYNCPVCKQAAAHVDGLVRATEGLRVAFVNNPILSSASREAARVVLTALRLRGPEAAYALHLRLFALRGVVDGARATAVALDLGLDLENASPQMRADADRALAAHEKLAGGVGFNVTPSYVLNGIGLFGHPGPKALARMVGAVKTCDELICG